MGKFLSKLKHFFIPSEKNNYRAKLLHPSFLAFIVFLFLVNQLAIGLFALVQPGVLGYSSEITPERIIELTNEERKKSGLDPLRVNDLLSEAAQMKAGDMFAFDYWAHKSPSGREPWSFFKEVNYDYRVAGENLARDFSEPGAVVTAWMKSPTHKENILNDKFREIGVAVVDGTLGGIRTTLVVQFFGTPMNFVATLPSSASGAAVATSEELAPSSTSLGLLNNMPISPLNLTRVLAIFFLGIIAGALVIDGYWVAKRKVYRSVGRTVAHTGFLLIIFILVLTARPGLIN